MASKINQLSARTVQTLSAPGRYGDGGGLYLLISPAGVKSWVYRFQLNGKRRDMGLGPYLTTGLPDARQAARDARDLVAKGIDPIEAKKAPPGVPTFGEAADDLVASLKSGWRGRRTEDSWKRSLEKHAAKIRPLPVDRVDTEAVLSVLRPIWSSKPESAGKLRLRIEHVLDAAKALNHIQGPWENPARWRNHLSVTLPKRQKLTRGHQRALPFGRIPAFMRELRKRRGTGALALEWTILTAARETMTLEATWSEIDRDVWVIPAVRMKAERPFRVPLPPACLEILARIRPEKSDPAALIFPGSKPGRPMSNATMDRVLERMKVDATPHGFRSTFRDWAGDETDAPREIAEMALAHEIGDEVEQAYRRGDALAKRRELMVLWAAYCADLMPIARLQSRPIGVRSRAQAQHA